MMVSDIRRVRLRSLGDDDVCEHVYQEEVQTPRPPQQRSTTRRFKHRDHRNKPEVCLFVITLEKLSTFVLQREKKEKERERGG
jgi:hypothetical protein